MEFNASLEIAYTNKERKVIQEIIEKLEKMLDFYEKADQKPELKIFNIDKYGETVVYPDRNDIENALDLLKYIFGNYTY